MIQNIVLSPLALLYGGAVRCRNLWYDRASAAGRSAGVPVVSIGNITAGGTGKTPLVIEIAARLRTWGRNPAILTRGYGAVGGRPSDEVLELQAALPGVPVVVDPDRVRGARAARERHLADCLLLDDGFQHRRLRRDLDIVLIDALNPWGGGRLLPAGRLREPVAGLSRAHVIILTRTNLAEASDVSVIRARINELVPGIPVLPARVLMSTCTDLGDGSIDSGGPNWPAVLPVCGVGNPRSFELLLEKQGVQSGAALRFSDHHPYTPHDVGRIIAEAQKRHAAVVTTRKDWVKLAPLWPRGVPLWRVDIRLEIDDPDGVLDAELRQALATKR